MTQGHLKKKRQKVAEWIKKKTHIYAHLQESHFRSKDTHTLKMRAWIMKKELG